MKKLSVLKYKFLNRHGALEKPIINVTSEEANRIIRDSILSESPAMIARFGAFELGMANSALTPVSIHNLIRLLKGEISSIGWSNSLANSLCTNAGFFPNDRNEIVRFAKLLTEDMFYLDVLASWLSGERRFEQELFGVKKIPLKDLEPFHHERPWTSALAGKKVLVVHPYEDSIWHQWNVKDKLFPSQDILPDFDLQIVKAVQSAAGTKSHFSSWFDALDFMKKEIERREFDIALIGCGAYGFHLAAHVKRMGRKAVHMGGVLQILFGIMGARWEGKYPFVNDYWIHPLECDRPTGANQIENGCYW